MLEKNSKKGLTNETKCAIIKPQKVKDRPKNQKGFDTMANENKTPRITKAQHFADIKAMLLGEDVPTLEDGTPRTTLDGALDFIDHEVDLLTKKNASGDKKQTETQKQNEGFMTEIVDYLTTATTAGDGDDAKKSGKTCTEIQAAIPSLAPFQNQKISRLCNMLADAGKITADAVKGKKLWRIAA